MYMFTNIPYCTLHVNSQFIVQVHELVASKDTSRILDSSN